MTNTIQDSIAGTCSVRKDRTSYSLDGSAERERSEHQTGREYLPMDVFVDPKTIRQHFQGSSMRAAWWAGIRTATA